MDQISNDTKQSPSLLCKRREGFHNRPKAPLPSFVKFILYTRGYFSKHSDAVNSRAPPLSSRLSSSPIPQAIMDTPTALRTAKATWELENNIVELEPSDAMFRYDEVQQKAVQQQKPWARNPHFFKHVRVSALALIKMTMHCRSGSNLEVMGMLQGKTVGDTFVVLDSFALPVEGTETRVNAQAEAYEYMVDFVQASKMVGRQEHVIGWSGYSLSGVQLSQNTTTRECRPSSLL